MLVKWLILPILIIGLLMLVYLQKDIVDMPRPDIDNTKQLADQLIRKSSVYNNISENVDSVNSDNEEGTERQPNLTVASNNLKKIEIYGKVLDQYRQPIEDVLVSEDQIFYYSRSDSNGLYRLILELPKHKLPKLSFLHSGYEDKKYDFNSGVSLDDSQIELNVILFDSTESIKVSGWIGNENGEYLPDQQIRISSTGTQGLEIIDHTVVSDEIGEFVFEAVKPDIKYRLDVYSTPEYAPYSISDLILNSTMPQLNITLKRLELVRVSGMFVDIEGLPIPDFEIDIINLTTRIHVRRIVSDSSGFFSLDDFPAGEVKFSSKAPRYFRITGLTLSGNEDKNLILRVDWGSYYLSGWVTDQNGIAVDRAMVTLDGEISSGELGSTSNRSTVTDSTGYFKFDQLGDTPHQITVHAQGFYKKELLHQFQSPASEVHISLTRQ